MMVSSLGVEKRKEISISMGQRVSRRLLNEYVSGMCKLYVLCDAGLSEKLVWENNRSVTRTSTHLP